MSQASYYKVRSNHQIVGQAGEDMGVCAGGTAATLRAAELNKAYAAGHRDGRAAAARLREAATAIWRAADQGDGTVDQYNPAWPALVEAIQENGGEL